MLTARYGYTALPTGLYENLPYTGEWNCNWSIHPSAMFELVNAVGYAGYFGTRVPQLETSAVNNALSYPTDNANVSDVNVRLCSCVNW